MCFDKIRKYWSKHVFFGNSVHTVLGIGLGLLAYTYVADSAYNLGVALLVLGLLGHAYAAIAKK